MKAEEAWEKYKAAIAAENAAAGKIRFGGGAAVNGPIMNTFHVAQARRIRAALQYIQVVEPENLFFRGDDE